MSHVTRRREAVVWSVGAASCFGGVSEGAHAAVSSNTSGQSLVTRRWPLYGSLALRFANHRRQHSCFCSLHLHSTAAPPHEQEQSTTQTTGAGSARLYSCVRDSARRQWPVICFALGRSSPILLFILNFTLTSHFLF